MLSGVDCLTIRHEEGTRLATTLTLAPQPSPATVCDCPFSFCTFRVPKVRAYIYAYNQALIEGDDPAEYIRDRVKSSRPGPAAVELRGQRPFVMNSQHFNDVKVALERARDVGGIPLQPWNAERVAAFLCERSGEGR